MHPTVDKTQDPQRFFVSFMYLSNKSIHTIIGMGNIIWFRYGSRVKKRIKIAAYKHKNYNFNKYDMCLHQTR